jgi:hypothetical protein
LQDFCKISAKRPENAGFNPVFIMAKTHQRRVDNPRPVSGHFQSGRQITQKLKNTPPFF